ncbi:MAG: glycosyltransferase family 39 protein, partial [Bryocella sp.]
CVTLMQEFCVDPMDKDTKSSSTTPKLHSSNLLKPAGLWFVLAVVALLALYARYLNLSFDGDFQGWASASCMTMAHSFNQLGAFHTHFVPIQNNLPLGLDPDFYLHWPPLFPLLLSFVTRIFGDRESSARLFALTITLATTAVLFLLARRYYGLRAALLTGFFFITARATYEGGRAILHQPLAIFFGSATVLFFLLAVDTPEPAVAYSASRRRLFAALGLCATVSTILTAWDPIFIALGLFLASIYLRRSGATRLAAVYLFANVVTFCAVQANYIAADPILFKNQLATIAYRAGLKFNASSSLTLNSIVDSVHYGSSQLSLVGGYSHAIRFVVQDFSTFSLLALFLFIALWTQSDRRRNSRAVYMLAGLFFPWVLFYLVMRNYVSIHSFALVLGAPFMAIASGFILDRIWEVLSTPTGPFGSQRRGILFVMVVILPLLTIYPLLMNVRDVSVPGFIIPEFRDLSAVIRQNTLANAVTLSPSESAVPIYYSDRHIVRGIATPELFQKALPQARTAFPGSPLFFALRDTDRDRFTEMLTKLNLVAHQGDSSLYAIP